MSVSLLAGGRYKVVEGSNMAKRKRTTKTGIIACSQKSKLQKDIPLPSLPEEIIVNILGRLPAKFLHNHARYVCKTWADILRLPSFIKPNFLPSNCVFLVHDNFRPYDAWFLEINKGKLEMTDAKLPFPGSIEGSSGGVLLIFDYTKVQTLYVANPVTMQVVRLPYIRLGIACVGSNIAHIPQTGEFKVVCPSNAINTTLHWYVLTVGGNMSWTRIDSTIPGCDLDVWFYNKSISAGGVLFWKYAPWKLDRSILALDLRDETVHNIRVPNELCDVYCGLLKIGNYLGCISGARTGTMKVCLLKDLHQNEWAITYRFDLNEKNPIRKYFSTPTAWLDNHQIMIFSVTKTTREVFVEFNGKTGKWKNIKNVDPYHYDIEVHTNSLVVL